METLLRMENFMCVCVCVCVCVCARAREYNLYIDRHLFMY